MYVLQDKDGKTASNILLKLVRQRHIKEAVHLEAQLDREREARIAEARTNVTAQRAQDRDRLHAAFEQVT